VTSEEAKSWVVSTTGASRVIFSEPSGFAHALPRRFGVTEEPLILLGAQASSSPATGFESALAGRKGRGWLNRFLASPVPT
jgi:hypothetical protein